MSKPFWGKVPIKHITTREIKVKKNIYLHKKELFVENLTKAHRILGFHES